MSNPYPYPYPPISLISHHDIEDEGAAEEEEEKCGGQSIHRGNGITTTMKYVRKSTLHMYAGKQASQPAREKRGEILSCLVLSPSFLLCTHSRDVSPIQKHVLERENQGGVSTTVQKKEPLENQLLRRLKVKRRVELKTVDDQEESKRSGG
jgi:hypothetical protein